MSPRGRPAVSVVVPFRGDRGAAERMVSALECLDLRDGDELIVADNTSDGTARSIARDGIRVITAARERSAYHARNEGARLATAAWILFLDADCRPALRLLAGYFERPVPGDCGAVAGQILGDAAERRHRPRADRPPSGEDRGPSVEPSHSEHER